MSLANYLILNFIFTKIIYIILKNILLQPKYNLPQGENKNCYPPATTA